jgi:hypothetical protein
MNDSGAATPAEPAANRWRSALLLVAAAALAPAVLVLGLATDAWPLMALAASVVALCAWSLVDIRSAFLVAVFLGTFVDYNTGRLALEMGVVIAWLAWTTLVLVWRGVFVGWVRPPAEMAPGLVIWLGACALGVLVGVLHGNRPQIIGIELAAALWPFLGLGPLQAYDRKSLAFAGAGLIGIGLIHTAFGLTMLGIYQRRLGGVYFTTVTGIVLVGLWTVTLLAPSRRVRIVCLLAMVPMLAHLVLSFTRGYWLGCLAGLAVATALSWQSLTKFDRPVRSRRLLMIPALGAVVVATLAVSALVFGGDKLLAAIGGRFGSSFSTEATGEALSNVIRIAEYDRAVAAALRSPVVGSGFGSSFLMRDPFLGTPQQQGFVHNYYLLIWFKLGIVGLLAFGVLVWQFVRAALRAAGDESNWFPRAWAIATIAVTCQVLVILATNYSLADVNTAFVFAFAWGVFWATRAGAGRAAG